MKKLKALVAVCMATTMLFGCGSAKLEGKTYTFSSELDIKNLDSSDADDGMSFNAMHACIDGLMGLDSNGNIAPAIAEKHEVSDDGKTHTFTLRDAKWSNGDAVTANDFVYAWQRILKKNGQYAYMMGSDGAAVSGVDEILTKQSLISRRDDEKQEDPVTEDDMKAIGLTMADLDKLAITDEDYNAMGVKAENDKTLVVTTTRKISYFEELMTFPCYYPINQKFCEEKGDKYAKEAANVLSNGAFVMDTWEPGSKAIFKKNTSYWNAGEVKIDNLVMNLVQEPKVAATSFDNGETDFAPINSDLVDKYKDNESYQTFNEGYLFYLSINFKNTDLANVNLRKALSLAINRDDFTANVLKDGSKGARGFVPAELSLDENGKDFRDSAETFTAYDVAKAQEALDAAKKELGKDTIKIRLLYGTDESPMDQLATYLQNAFTKLNGLEIEMVATTKQDRIYNKQANGDYDICCTRWGPDYGDPTTYLNLLISTNSNNYGKYNSKAFDAMMNQVTSTDGATRWANMIAAEKIAMDDYGYIPVFEKGTSVLANTKVSGLIHRPVGVPYTFNYVDVAE